MTFAQTLQPEEVRSICRCAIRYAKDRKDIMNQLRNCRQNLIQESVDPGTLRRHIRGIATTETQLNYRRDAPSELQELYVPAVREVFLDADVHMEAKEIWENNEIDECYLRTWRCIKNALLGVDEKLKCYGFVSAEKWKMVAILEMLVVQVGRLREALVGLVVVDKFADEMDEIAKCRGSKWSNNRELWSIWDQLQQNLKCGCTACTPLDPENCADPVFYSLSTVVRLKQNLHDGFSIAPIG
ncbi:uncharacterized protein N7496_007401 [Penicillium cataractarum]|uniref:Uncharacterized protein n=1 Tax=Penicillium cataractarum TaxID=2100454 RepID=A0A9W9S5F9_9EURO|nr:uncharacterized protein N7496_007401 [Penicillium cataractarum]KAJ5371309.1 hypothetical protein N7496_007401 [Penicillium cataractarum]